jgi:hypothetical protein
MLEPCRVPSVAIPWENKAEFSPDKKQLIRDPFTVYFEISFNFILSHKILQKLPV